MLYQWACGVRYEPDVCVAQAVRGNLADERESDDEEEEEEKPADKKKK